MKKRLKIICGIGILIVAVFLYAHIEKAHEIYDKDIDPSEYGNVIEEKPVTLKQQFILQESTLDGFKIKGVENGDISKVDIIYSISQTSEDNQSSVNFSFEKGIERNTKLIMNREEIDGTLIMKTITKRFDLETFFVVMLFAVYIIFFIRLLYKLFK